MADSIRDGKCESATDLRLQSSLVFERLTHTKSRVYSLFTSDAQAESILQKKTSFHHKRKKEREKKEEAEYEFQESKAARVSQFA